MITPQLGLSSKFYVVIYQHPDLDKEGILRHELENLIDIIKCWFPRTLQ